VEDTGRPTKSCCNDFLGYLIGLIVKENPRFGKLQIS